MSVNIIDPTPLSIEDRKKVISACMDRIEADKIAEVSAVAQAIGIRLAYNHEALIIAHALKETGKYDFLIKHEWPVVFKNPGYKKPLFRDKHPFWYAFLLTFIAAIFSLGASIILLSIENQQENLKEDQVNKRLQDLSDSVSNLQKHITDSSFHK